MSKRSDDAYFGDMLDAARRAYRKAAGLTQAEFDSDDNLQLAIVYLLQTVGEAASHVSETGRSMHPEIEWERIVGMRHRIVHDYLRVDFDIVWHVAREDLLPLIAILQGFVAPEPPS